MPIEIKEITIKATVYPEKKPDGGAVPPFSAADLEQLKKEITGQVTERVLQKISNATER